MGAVAFWLALAAVLIASGFLRARGAQMRHEMIMKLIEKGVALDDASMRVLLGTDTTGAPARWVPPPSPSPRQVAKSFGTLILFGAMGLAVFFAIALRFAAFPPRDALTGLAVAAGVAVFAVGLFVAARYAADPQSPNGHAANPTDH